MTEIPSFSSDTSQDVSSPGMARLLVERLYALTCQQIEGLERYSPQAGTGSGPGEEDTPPFQPDEKDIKALSLLTKQLDHILVLENRLLELEREQSSLVSSSSSASSLPFSLESHADEMHTLAEQRRQDLAQRLEKLRPGPDESVCGQSE